MDETVKTEFNNIYAWNSMTVLLVLGAQSV